MQAKAQKIRLRTDLGETEAILFPEDNLIVVQERASSVFARYLGKEEQHQMVEELGELPDLHSHAVLWTQVNRAFLDELARTRGFK